MTLSQNGWPTVGRDRIKTAAVPGSAVRLPILDDADVRDLLIACAVVFDRRVEDIDTRKVTGYTIPDDWGYAARKVRQSQTVWSNHASGTAIDLNATRHPRFKRGTFNAAQLHAMNTFIAKLDGAVRWGENYSRSRVDGMHFEINTTDRTKLHRAAVTANAEVSAILHPPAPATAARPVIIRRTLRFRKVAPLRGNDVIAVQRVVGARLTGVYDGQTAGSVRRWQARVKIKVDGIFGPESCRKSGLIWRG